MSIKRTSIPDLPDREAPELIVGERCVVNAFSKGHELQLQVGSNVQFHNDVRIICDGPLIIGDNVTLHNHVSILGAGPVFIGNNTWIGQYTMLDSQGGLEIGEDCCIGYNCQIWSHRKRVPSIEGNKFPDMKRKTILKDRVWLLGGLTTVQPGVTIEEDCVIFNNSVVTKSTKKGIIYAGIPAKRLLGPIQFPK